MAQTSEPLKGNPADAITLVSFPGGHGATSSLTPFGCKVETILRIAGLPYEGKISSSEKKHDAPKAKLPVIHHGPNKVSDSSFITRYLFNTYPAEMAVLKPADASRAAVVHAAKRLIEESLYFVSNYFSWQMDEGWERLRKAYFENLPFFLQPIVPRMVRGQIIRDLHGQGMGRLSSEDVLSRGREDCAALSEILGSHPYLAGDTPTEADASLFGIIDVCVSTTMHGPDSKLGKLFAEHPNLLAFHKRIKEKYYAEPGKLHRPVAEKPAQA